MPDDNQNDNPPTEDFASMLAEYDAQHAGERKKRQPRVGESVKGRIVSIGSDSVFLDVGGKSEGMIAASELRDADGKLTVAVGDEIEARVVEADDRAGCIVLRRVLGRGPNANAELEQAFQHGIPVEGVVTGVNKGGVEVQIAGARAFCPISQLDQRHVEDASTYVGQRLTFRITRFEAGRRDVNIVVSRRALLEEENKTRAAATRGTLAVGAVVRGTVTTLKEYGAFVDLGGIEGMLHISELGFSRVAHPRDVLTVGQQVEVQILKMEKSEDPKRPDREKISLSLKSLEKDPWLDVVERFPEGSRLRGTVARLETFGAFIEVVPGVEGLLHISELGAGKRINHARDAVKVGQAIDVSVLGVDRDRRRIALALVNADDASGEAVASASSAAPRSLGTFGDLLKKKK